MAEEIKKQAAVEVELIAGSGGVFDVVVDDRLIFSKHEVGRFPEHDEILSQISAS